MNFNLIFKIIFLSLCLLGSFENSQAQSPPLIIKAIRKFSANDEKEVPIKIVTENVRIHRDQLVESGKVGSGINVNNRLTVDKFFTVGLRFHNVPFNQRGEFVFLTHSLDKDKQKQYNGAEYEIQERGKEIDIIIKKGSVIAKTSKGNRFRVVAGKLLSVMGPRSTTIVMFSVSADTGMIFLEKGSPGALSFPGHETFPDSVRKTMTRRQIRQGDVFIFKGDKVTRHTDISKLFKAGAATALALIDNAKYYDKLFSRKPFWQKPKYYVPAALLITIPTIFIFEGNKNLPGPPGVPVIHR